ncbi:binding-protein-dependent transport systems inner membrane component [Candidatus Vecturithrix granuli]|uniref:Binding-protein-dependent transport systems inner membrane component n=1 Tax=Vecturithrix granuli TaxID=1499967 RepID=A0A081C4R8_VECG1|nr:binding-protein-dependent transport systems inner membrane component [Candidatus Vecturithrix granuli]
MKKFQHYLMTYFVLLLYFSFLLLPMIWIIYSSFRTQDAIFSGRILSALNEFTLENYRKILAVSAFSKTIMNSFKIATGVTLITMLLATMGGYGLSRYQVRGRDFFILGIFSSQMFPPVLILLPLYTWLLSLGFVDTYPGIILAQTMLSLPFTVWMLKGYFDNTPRELDEAARIDGCSTFGILFRIIFPIAAPGILVAAFFAFMVSWGDYLIVSVLAQSNATATMPFSLARISSSLRVKWGDVAAAAVLTIVPTLILFTLVQKWLVEGLTAGAVKQ